MDKGTACSKVRQCMDEEEVLGKYSFAGVGVTAEARASASAWASDQVSLADIPGRRDSLDQRSCPLASASRRARWGLPDSPRCL